TSWSVTEQSDSKNADHIRRVGARPLFAVLRADARVLPKVAPSGDNYDAGRLLGKLVISRIDTGASICAIPFSAESSPRVKFKERGTTGTTLERAILDDFKTQVRASIATATKAAAPAFTVDVGS